jgi:hypothetical protein
MRISRTTKEVALYAAGAAGLIGATPLAISSGVVLYKEGIGNLLRNISPTAELVLESAASVGGLILMLRSHRNLSEMDRDAHKEALLARIKAVADENRLFNQQINRM